MNILYENLKKVGAIISVYPQKARVFEVLLPTIMMLTGYWIGYDLFLY